MAIVPDREGAAEVKGRKSPPDKRNGPGVGASLRAFIPFAFVAAMLAAPLLASFVRLEAGLLVMGVALLATASLLRASLDELPARHGRLLRVLLAINVALAIACFVAAIARLA